MIDGFLHLTDAEDGTPVRIRISKIDSMYVHQQEADVVHAFHGPVRTAAKDEPFTMLVYGEHGTLHGVRETIDQVEGQMADFYEVAGIAAAQ